MGSASTASTMRRNAAGPNEGFPRREAGCCTGPGTFAKKAANCQKSSWLHVSNGWWWHWAHWTRTPRKTSAVLIARSSDVRAVW